MESTVRRIRRLGLAMALAVTVAGLAATAAQACTLPWTRSPNDGVHYFAGAMVTNQAANQNLNGADANIFINDPTLHQTYYTDSWVGIQTYDSQGEPVLVQDGYMKFAGASRRPSTRSAPRWPVSGTGSPPATRPSTGRTSR